METHNIFIVFITTISFFVNPLFAQNNNTMMIENENTEIEITGSKLKLVKLLATSSYYEICPLLHFYSEQGYYCKKVIVNSSGITLELITNDSFQHVYSFPKSLLYDEMLFYLKDDLLHWWYSSSKGGEQGIINSNNIIDILQLYKNIRKVYFTTEDPHNLYNTLQAYCNLSFQIFTKYKSYVEPNCSNSRYKDLIKTPLMPHIMNH